MCWLRQRWYCCGTHLDVSCLCLFFWSHDLFCGVRPVAGQGYVEALTPEQQHQVGPVTAQQAVIQTCSNRLMLPSAHFRVLAAVPSETPVYPTSRYIDCHPWCHGSSLTTSLARVGHAMYCCHAHLPRCLVASLLPQAFLSRLLLMLGSFVIMCLLLF